MICENKEEPERAASRRPNPHFPLLVQRFNLFFHKDLGPRYMNAKLALTACSPMRIASLASRLTPQGCYQKDVVDGEESKNANGLDRSKPCGA